MSTKNKKQLYTVDDLDLFDNDKVRIKQVSKCYSSMSITDAFSKFYNEEISKQVHMNAAINNIIQIELGEIYSGVVKSFDKSGITFEFPGVKEDIICKENFNDCVAEINNYLLTHNNRLLFKVREKKNNTYYVSIIDAYYSNWVDSIQKAIKKEEGIQVHIDALVSGGYTCHTYIVPLVELTGRMYTQLVFIPGSLIVLNIERDFERWIGEDVVIVPQNFVDFRTNKYTGERETSLVGSRKRVLQIIGMRNLEEYYKQYQLVNQTKSKYDSGELEGIVTGIINSNNKTGIFVELVDKFITGFAPVDSQDLLDYLPGDTVYVKINKFEVQDGKEPFIYYKGRVSKSNTRIVFEVA